MSGPTQAELPLAWTWPTPCSLSWKQFDDPRAGVRLLASIVESALSESAVPDERTCLMLGCW